MKKKFFFISWIIMFGILFGSNNAFSATIYVNAASVYSSSNADAGTSWEKAFSDLQDALADAVSGDEIWVAKGVYRPTKVINRTPEMADRVKSFEMKNGVNLFGGFAGTETDKETRNLSINISELNGDIDDDSDKTYNSYQVLTSAANTSFNIDGFTFSEGYANRFDDSDDKGAAIFLNGDINSIIQISRCKFTNNEASRGGAIYNIYNKIELTDCNFVGNTALYGAGIYSSYGEADLSGCNFSENIGRTSAGSIYNDNTSFKVVNSSFSNESSNSHGGSILSNFGMFTIDGCTIDNSISSSGRGGGIYLYQTPMTITNSTIAGNKSYLYGGGIYNFKGDLTLINSTISLNICGNGFTGFDEGGGGVALYGDSKLKIINTILFNNSYNSSSDDYINVNNDGTTTSLGHNIVGTASPASDFNTSLGDIFPSSLTLGALANNGGPTKTMAICSADSPAKDNGASSSPGIVIPAVDQRGIARETDAFDIGAYESKLNDPPTSPTTTPTTASSISENITASTAILSGSFLPADADQVTSYGIVWSTQSSPDVSSGSVTEGDAFDAGTGYFEASLTGLSEDTLYYERAFIQYSQGCGDPIALYGPVYAFRTEVFPPDVTWDGENSYITATTAQLPGTVGNLNEAIAYGYAYGTSGTFSEATLMPLTVETDGTYSISLTGLLPSTDYYIWIYTENSDGKKEPAASKLFTTLAQLNVPTLKMVSPENITSVSAKLTATLEDMGTGISSISDHGFILSKSEDLATIDAPVKYPMDPPDIGESQSLPYTFTIPEDPALLSPELEPATTYYVKAYAVSTNGAGYSSIKSFTTDPVLPEINMLYISEIDTHSAKLYGQINTLGLTGLTYGFMWGESPLPDAQSSSGITHSSDTNFYMTISDLDANTQYYARAYAENSSGQRTYSNDFIFHTFQEKPEVQTLDAVIDPEGSPEGSVQLKASIVNSGNPAATSYGFILSSSTTFTVDDSGYLKISGSDITSPDAGSFYHILNPAPEGKYYFRAFIENEAGVHYGEMKSFGTNELDVNNDGAVNLNDTISTLQVLADTPAPSATSGADINSDGKIGFEEAIQILKNEAAQ